MLPLNDIHGDIHRLERSRSGRPAPEQAHGLARRSTFAGLRYAVGRTLIAGGRALSGSAESERRATTNPRPVSAHR